jgi:hypothetical protein
LEIVEVGIDDDGDEVTSCVIEPVEGLTARKKTKTLPPSAAKALKALHEILDDAGIIPPPDTYIPAATKAVTITEWREHAFKRGIGGGELKSQQQAFRRAFDILTANNRVAVSEPYAWPL